MKNVSKNTIPRGCRSQFNPGLSKDIKQLYNNYREKYEADPFSEETSTLGDLLTEELSLKRRAEWQKLIENIDMKHSSRTAWKTIKKLNNDLTLPKEEPKVTPNQVASQLIKNGKTSKTSCQKIKR